MASSCTFCGLECFLRAAGRVEPLLALAMHTRATNADMPLRTSFVEAHVTEPVLGAVNEPVAAHESFRSLTRLRRCFLSPPPCGCSTAGSRSSSDSETLCSSIARLKVPVHPITTPSPRRSEGTFLGTQGTRRAQPALVATTASRPTWQTRRTSPSTRRERSSRFRAKHSKRRLKQCRTSRPSIPASMCAGSTWPPTTLLARCVPRWQTHVHNTRAHVHNAHKRSERATPGSGCAEAFKVSCRIDSSSQRVSCDRHAI